MRIPLRSPPLRNFSIKRTKKELSSKFEGGAVVWKHIPTLYSPYFSSKLSLSRRCWMGRNVKMKFESWIPGVDFLFPLKQNGIVSLSFIRSRVLGSKANPAIWLDRKRRRCSTNLQGIFFTLPADALQNCFRFLRGLTTLRNIGGKGKVMVI